ncbi:MAG: matrixin family metalloprotease [Clostridia bacterium]|nr:matrixin family metalloprotease [Clostridia bacterium]
MAATVLALVVALSVRALAYTLLGGSWASVDPLDYRFGSITEASKTAFTYSLAAWNNAQQSARFAAGDSSAPVTLSDVDDPGAAWDGITYLEPCGGCQYTSAVAELNTHWTSSYTGAERQSVAAHELGHVLGLGHESGAVLMNPYTCGETSRWCTYGINTPQSDDVQGVEDLYAGSPHGAPTP